MVYACAAQFIADYGAKGSAAACTCLWMMASRTMMPSSSHAKTKSRSITSIQDGVIDS